MRNVFTVLYLVSKGRDVLTREEMDAVGGRARRGAKGRDWMVVSHGGVSYQLRVANTIPESLQLLEDQYFNFVVVDNRTSPNENNHGDDCFTGTLAREFMHRVHYSADPERMYPKARIIAALDPDECLADQAFELGKLKIGGYVTNPFDGSLFEMMAAIGAQAVPGKSAICLAGGGVEGFLFEMGVCMALNAHLQNTTVADFDIYCGISAGAILAAFLANGIPPEHMHAAMNGPVSKELGVYAIKPGDIFDPSFKEYGARTLGLGRKMAWPSATMMLSNLLKSVPVGFFRGEGIRRWIEKNLDHPGRSNDFRELDRELYIGATDQDSSDHVIFGHGVWRDVPISQAVRASTALTPFFVPELIRGRYFVDGQYTRTSNFHFAVERGARLVLVLDPLIPFKVDQPGYVKAKGGVFASLQGLKSVIHTRFMHSIKGAAESHPEVDFVLFKPEAEDMKLMSGSPMKYRIRTEIVNAAYRCTVKKIQKDFEILAGTFAKHGMRLQRYPRLRSKHTAIF